MLEEALREPGVWYAPTRRRMVRGGALLVLGGGSALAAGEYLGWLPLTPGERIVQWNVSRDVLDAPGNPGFQADAVAPDVYGKQLRITPESDRLIDTELQFDAATKSGTLFVDGRRVLEGYEGHTQFQVSEGHKIGFLFGVGTYRGSTAGVGYFASVELEIAG